MQTSKSFSPFALVSELTLTDSKLKELLKVALTEILQEQRELFAEVVLEVLEDVALAKAMKEGEETELVSRDTIFEILRSNQTQTQQ
jgi:hypothetical protein